MEKIDRELLIKEISSRLSYGIKAQVLGWDEEKGEVEVPLKVYSINTDGYLSFEYNHYRVETVYVEDCRLYLRPMSSMTNDEIAEFKWLNDQCDTMPTFEYVPVENYRIYDWMNRHHFDFRNLIERGLAIEVTEENNPYRL